MRLKRFTTQLIAAGLIALPLAAHAAGLGKLSVNSALGQPLSAEIELFAADQAELESLAANLASDQAFRDARVEFAPVLSTLRFAVEKKPGNKAVLKVTSTRPVNDPFVDFLVELNWASGRLVREYTMLLDPPGVAVQQKISPVAVAPAVTAPPAAKPAPAPATAPAAVVKPAPAAAMAPVPDTIEVKRGDTLGGIARRVRPEGVSLEQTLVGLFRENTRAFEGNMNRLRAGAKLNIPDAEKLAAITPQEAGREVRLQAADWRAYRQKLAEAVAQAAEPSEQAKPGQAASGQITAKVDDAAKPSADDKQDVLKLSRVAPPADGAAKEAAALQEKLRAQEEDALARERALEESSERVAMLEKQVQDMQELVRMKEEALNGAAEAPPPAPSVAPKVQAPAPEPAQNWYDPLLANPLYWAGGAAIVGLGGLLWWMMAGGARRRKSPVTLDDSIMSGGDVRPNTVVGAASGGSVNTGDTSFLTDFSQAGLGTIDTHDVDPIAEAEVYMAYGRDAQAEEILKEAILKTPDRHEIRVKLLEIYAARRNTAAFEAAAGEFFAALGGKPSPLWDRVCDMGRSIDPTNPLYGGAQSNASSAPAATTVAATTAIAGGAMALDSFNEEPEPVIGDMPEAQPVPESEMAADNAPMNFENAGNILEFDHGSEGQSAPQAEAGAAAHDAQDLEFDLSGMGEGESQDELKLDLGMEADNGPDSAFNFGDLDLDLGESGGNDLELDEVATKLDLARAYLEMGDKDGAREILNEVISEGNDSQRADATGMLSSIG
jgi:pilus assembly protein FimV